MSNKVRLRQIAAKVDALRPPTPPPGYELDLLLEARLPDPADRRLLLRAMGDVLVPALHERGLPFLDEPMDPAWLRGRLAPEALPLLDRLSSADGPGADVAAVGVEADVAADVGAPAPAPPPPTAPSPAREPPPSGPPPAPDHARRDDHDHVVDITAHAGDVPAPPPAPPPTPAAPPRPPARRRERGTFGVSESCWKAFRWP
jgi:hypothetical protein